MKTNIMNMETKGNKQATKEVAQHYKPTSKHPRRQVVEGKNKISWGYVETYFWIFCSN